MFIRFRRCMTVFGVGLCFFASAVAQLSAETTTESRSPSLFDSDLPAPGALNPGPASSGATGLESIVPGLDPAAPSDLAIAAPFEMMPLLQTAPAAALAPPKPAGPPKPPPQPWKGVFFDNDFS